MFYLGHLSSHTEKSFYRNIYKIKPMSKIERLVFNNLFKYKNNELLTNDEKNIIKNYYSNIYREVFDYIFNYGNKNLKADLIILNDKKTKENIEYSTIHVIDQDSLYNHYVKNNFCQIQFDKHQICFMNKLFSLEIRTKGFQYHLFKDKLIEKFD